MKNRKIYGKDLLKDKRVPERVKQQIRNGAKHQARDNVDQNHRAPHQPPTEKPQPSKDRKTPLKQRVKEYFRPRTRAEAEQFEREQEELKKRSSQPEQRPAEERGIEHSRFIRDVQKFRGGVRKALDKHREWVEEGNRKYAEQHPEGEIEGEEDIPREKHPRGERKGERKGERRGEGRMARPGPDPFETPRVAGYPGPLSPPPLGSFDTSEEDLTDLLGYGGGGMSDLHQTMGFHGPSTSEMDQNLLNAMGYGGGGGGGGRSRRPQKTKR